MPAAGFEPVTYALRVRCYIEINPHKRTYDNIEDLKRLLYYNLIHKRTHKDVFRPLFAPYIFNKCN